MPTVLICEDHRAIRNLHLQMFKLHLKNFIFESANNGEEAFNKVANNGIDLVLMDLRMPKLDGFGAIELVRQVANKMPIIVISAYGDSASRKTAMDAGAIAFYEKPLDEDEYRRIAALIIEQCKHKTTQLDRKPILRTWYKNLNTLLEREASYGGNAPLELLNQIEDIKSRIRELENES